MIVRLVLVGGCAALLLGACSKPDQPGTLPPLSTPSVSPSPSPAASTTPSDEKSVIVALAKDYYAESNRALESGNTVRLKSLSTPTCPCLAYAKGVDEAWAQGSVRAHEYYLVIQAVPVVRSPVQGFVTIIYQTNGYTVLDKRGRPAKTYAADRNRQSSLVTLVKQQGRWRIGDVVRT